MTTPAVGDLATAAWAGLHPPAASGSTTVTTVANTVTTVAITFPVGRFSAAPVVIPQVASPGLSASQTVSLWATSVTTAGCTLNILRSNATSTPIAWVAVQSV